jgi:hypothetical protein
MTPELDMASVEVSEALDIFNDLAMDENPGLLLLSGRAKAS